MQEASLKGARQVEVANGSPHCRLFVAEQRHDVMVGFPAKSHPPLASSCYKAEANTALESRGL